MIEDMTVHARICRLILFSLMFIGVAGCQDFGDAYDVDPRLVGDWYRFDTLNLAPGINLDGMHITPEGMIQPLGIELATGRLAVMEGEEVKHILLAKDGLLVVQHVAPPDIATDSLRYLVAYNRLVLSDTYRSIVYRRSQLGSVVTHPEEVILSVGINDTPVQSPRVWPRVPAFVRRLSASAVQLCADIPGGQIRIEVEPFSGAGSYSIGAGKGVLSWWLGDVALQLRTDSLSTGTIHIDLYDEVARRCSGRFAFSARWQGLPSDPPIVRHLRDGYFSVPLYH